LTNPNKKIDRNFVVLDKRNTFRVFDS